MKLIEIPLKSERLALEVRPHEPECARKELSLLRRRRTEELLRRELLRAPGAELDLFEADHRHAVHEEVRLHSQTALRRLALDDHKVKIRDLHQVTGAQRLFGAAELTQGVTEHLHSTSIRKPEVSA